MTTTSLSNCTERGAVISDCRLYRWWLFRSESRIVRNACGWVLNNPSIADGEFDDPTIRRVWDFTQRWGHDSAVVVNTNPHRSTDPKLARMPPEGLLAVNDNYLRMAMQGCNRIVCGWGDKANEPLAARAVKIMHELGPLSYLRLTKRGNPGHPLYLPATLEPQLWLPSRHLQ